MKNLQRLLRNKELLALCFMIFTADIVSGIVSPTFSLYATSLGASLAFIGALSSVVGLTRILSSVPIGVIADAKGRKNVLSAGMLFHAASTFFYAMAPNPHLLLPIRILTGWAIISTFFMGVAYLGDIVTSQQRGLAIGLYATFMGSGFTIGSLVGGTLVANYSYVVCYRVAAMVALVGFAIARRGLVNRSANGPGTGAPKDTTSLPGMPLSAKLNTMAKEPALLAASVANMLMSAVFGGAITNFFPLYAASLSVGEATIGSMFAARSLVSTFARVPTGFLTTRLSSGGLMATALALVTISVVLISFTTTPVLLGIFLAGEGIAFGMFLTSGQTFVSQHASEADRGTAIGFYSTAGSIGSTAGPLILGLIADWWGIVTTFRVTGAMVFVGIVVLGIMSLRQRRALPAGG
jgi:DHA1 family multidrug resistance protein-like MFS transporter